MRKPSPHAVLTPEALAAAYAHARLEYPYECCGIAFGPRDRPVADRIRRCRNVQGRLHAEDPGRYRRTARTAYQLDDEDVLALWCSFEGPRPGKIVYHSHVETNASFSGGDQRAAGAGNRPAHPVNYLVIEVRADGVHGAIQYGWHRRRRRYVEVCHYEGQRTQGGSAGLCSGRPRARRRAIADRSPD